MTPACLRYILSFLFMLPTISATTSELCTIITKTEPSLTDSTPQQQPSFPGGMEAFCQYIRTQFHYPTRDVQGMPPKGLISFRFFVTPKGKICNASILHYLHPKCDRELLRVLNESPQWDNSTSENDSIAFLYEGATVIHPAKEMSINLVRCTCIGSQSIPLTPESIQADSIKLYQESLDMTEQMPEFVGGTSALLDYIQKQLYYDYNGQAGHQIQGRVIITCIIDEEGFVRYPKIERSLDPSTDREAMRIIRELPRWNPGRHNGKKVSVRYTIPVVFRLQ